MKSRWLETGRVSCPGADLAAVSAKLLKICPLQHEYAPGRCGKATPHAAKHDYVDSPSQGIGAHPAVWRNPDLINKVEPGPIV